MGRMSRPRPRSLLAAALAALLLVNWGAEVRAQEEAPERSYPDGVVALVEGTPITRYELELSCRLTRNDYRELPLGSSAAQRIRHEELTRLIEHRVLVQRAQEEEVKFTEDDQRRLDFELGRQAEAYGGIEGLRQALSAIGVPYDYFVARQKANLLVNKLLVKNISHDIFVTPVELRRAYEKNRARYQRAGETRFRQIVLYADPAQAVRVPEAVKERVEAGSWDPQAYASELRQRILSGESFEEVALETSMGIRHDAELVIESPRTLVPPLDALVAELGVGEVSQARTDTRRGAVYLVFLVDRRPAGVLSFEEVQEELEGELKEEFWARRVKAWIEKVTAEADVRRFLPEQ